MKKKIAYILIAAALLVASNTITGLVVTSNTNKKINEAISQNISTPVTKLPAENGEDGHNGKDGEAGAKGDTGAKGDKGDTGAKGEKGDTGEKGEKGDAGVDGKSSYVEFNANDSFFYRSGEIIRYNELNYVVLSRPLNENTPDNSQFYIPLSKLAELDKELSTLSDNTDERYNYLIKFINDQFYDYNKRISQIEEQVSSSQKETIQQNQ